MKTTKFFAAAFAVAAILASCSKEESGKNPANGGQETYIGVALTFPKTKANDTSVSKAWEDEVTEAGIYVVNPNGTVDGAVLPVNASGVAQGTLKTTTGTKDIYVIANPTQAIKDKIAAVRGAAFGANGGGYVITDFVTSGTSMVMSGSRLGETLVLQTMDEATAAPLAFNIYRNVAQVVVNTNKNWAAASVTGGAITDLKFCLESKALDSYLVPQGAIGSYYTMFNPWADNAAYYANFSTLNKVDYVTVSAQGDASVDHSYLNAVNSFYCFENRIASKHVGNTTAARIRGIFTPAANTVVTAYVPATKTRTLGTIAAGTDFYVKKSDNSYWSQAAYDAAVDGVTGDMVAANFYYYKGGYAHYRIWVQNASNVVEANRNNFYELTIDKITGPGTPGDPTDPEYPDPNFPDPTDPEEDPDPIDQTTFISFTVTVQPWDRQSSGHEL